MTTLEWASKRLGTTTIEQLSGSAISPSAKQGGATGESYAPRTTAVLEPDEIALVFGRADPMLRQLIVRAGFGPMYRSTVLRQRSGVKRPSA
jgi:type IV secretion system protein VirD4